MNARCIYNKNISTTPLTQYVHFLQYTPGALKILCDSHLSLLDSGALPGAECTRQRLLCTRQSVCRVQHSAKSLRQKISRQRFLCRVLFIGHSAKTLPSANPAPAKKSGRYGAGSVIPYFAGCHVRGTRQRFF